jgi:thiamine biosynthesis lipoprotein
MADSSESTFERQASTYSWEYLLTQGNLASSISGWSGLTLTANGKNRPDATLGDVRTGLRSRTTLSDDKTAPPRQVPQEEGQGPAASTIFGLVERRFRTMGTEIRVLVGARIDDADPEPEAIAASIEEQLAEFDRRLSRFRPDSELSLLNQDPREQVPASALLRAAVGAGVWGAQRTDGLVDPTLLPQLEAAGYASSRSGVASAPLETALATAPPRRPARPEPQAKWRSVRVLEDTGAIRRPPGVKLDSGGTGKGLAADLVAQRLAGYARYAIDCGGDVRVGGRLPYSEPIELNIRHPLSGTAAECFTLDRGAVATSGLDARLWRLADGNHAHHLIDPASGEPAWTGLICAAARAPTALEADVLAKAALLSGPDRASEFLAEHGGLIVKDDGTIERIGPLRDPPRLRASPPR